MAVIYPFMQGLRESPFPAPGKTVTIKSFIPESGTEVGGVQGLSTFWSAPTWGARAVCWSILHICSTHGCSLEQWVRLGGLHALGDVGAPSLLAEEESSQW